MISKGRIHNYSSRYKLSNEQAEKELIKRHKEAEKIRVKHANFMYDFYNLKYFKIRNKVLHELVKQKIYISYSSAFNSLVRGVSLNKLPSKQIVKRLNYAIDLFYETIEKNFTNEQYRQKAS